MAQIAVKGKLAVDVSGNVIRIGLDDKKEAIIVTPGEARWLLVCALPAALQVLGPEPEGK